VYLEGLQEADPSTKGSYQVLIDVIRKVVMQIRTVTGWMETEKVSEMDKYTGKGKAFPLQARGGPEGSRKLRFPDFVTTAQDGGKVISLTHRPPFPPGNIPGTHFC